MTFSTHILILLIGFIYPIYFLITHKKTNNRIKKNDYFRLVDYKQTIFLFWLLTIFVLGNSYIDNSLLINLRPTFNTTGIVLGILILIFIILQIVSSKVSTEEKAISISEKMKDIFHYLPKSKLELVWFNLLSVSAGFCEEIIFRLFMFTYLIEQTNLGVAFILTNIIFALTHIGSGKKNLAGAFILGLLFTSIYYFTRNIWLSMILHSAIDISAGVLGYGAHKILLIKNGKD